MPDPLSRSALERVLARAAELQSGAGDAPEALTEDQLLDIGKEVGLAPEHLRQALAEERTRTSDPDLERGWRARLIGAAHVRAGRSVPGTPRDILAAIDTWMQREELLQVKRHTGDRMVWEPRRDFFGNLRRVLNLGGRGYALTRVDEVAATAVAVDDSRVLVHIEAALVGHRAGLETNVSVGTLLGIAVGGSLALMGVMIPVAVVPALAAPGIGVYSAREFQHRARSRAQLALEQLLDRLERGELSRPPSLLGTLAAVATARPPLLPPPPGSRSS